MTAGSVIVALASALTPERTLWTGTFGEPGGSLMIAANAGTGHFSGYYDGGRCRFSLRGTLTPLAVERLETYREGYEAEAWEPDHPDQFFSVTLYSQVSNGYRQQITLEFGRSGSRPAECASRVTLDRAGSNSDVMTDVRVVKPGRIQLYDVRMRGRKGAALPVAGSRPRAWSGVWISKTFSPNYSPPGYLYINWYVDGVPKSAYVRPRALFPVPVAE